MSGRVFKRKKNTEKRDREVRKGELGDEDIEARDCVRWQPSSQLRRYISKLCTPKCVSCPAKVTARKVPRHNTVTKKHCMDVASLSPLLETYI